MNFTADSRSAALISSALHFSDNRPIFATAFSAPPLKAPLEVTNGVPVQRKSRSRQSAQRCCKLGIARCNKEDSDLETSVGSTLADSCRSIWSGTEPCQESLPEAVPADRIRSNFRDLFQASVMGNGFQQDKDLPASSSLLENAHRLTSNAAELAQCAKTSRAHIASIRSQIEQIRNTAASAQLGCSRAHDHDRDGAAVGSEADSSGPALHDPQGHDPQGKAVILTALLVVFISIISRASRR